MQPLSLVFIPCTELMLVRVGWERRSTRHNHYRLLKGRWYCPGHLIYFSSSISRHPIIGVHAFILFSLWWSSSQMAWELWGPYMGDGIQWQIRIGTQLEWVHHLSNVPQNQLKEILYDATFQNEAWCRAWRNILNLLRKFYPQIGILLTYKVTELSVYSFLQGLLTPSSPTGPHRSTIALGSSSTFWKDTALNVEATDGRHLVIRILGDPPF